MDVVFFGSGEFGLPTLEALAKQHRLAGIVSQPDRPAGRGGKLTPTPVSAWAIEHAPSVPLIRPEDVNEPGVRERVRALADPKAPWVVIAFGQKLSPELLADRFAINLHGSLLPRWRGAGPIQAAMLAGDSHTGNSVITLAQRMDAGLVLGTTTLEIAPTATSVELHDALAAQGPGVVLSVLAGHEQSALRPLAQDESLVTKARKLRKEDRALDWGLKAEEIRRRINALSPWPGVTVTFRGQPLKLLRANTDEGSSEQRGKAPGTIVDAAGLVATGGGLVRLLDVQPAGKRAMAWDEFARGARVTAGEVLVGGAAGAGLADSQAGEKQA
ncbi:MAG: methionyl-tRNA formyltransferase [Planctomycetota bacterium]|nr:methionyl-tRNA formyltransferase [Planctomycetota bacterium]